MPLKIGARITKTALAVVICVFLGSFFNEKSGFFSAVAAIITMQSTISDSFIKGWGRILGTFVGAFLGYFFTLISYGNIFLVGLGIIITIYICKLLKWNTSIIIACVVFLSIMLDADKNVLQYSIFRLLDTTSGIIIAFWINYFIMPYRPLLAVYKDCEKIIDEFYQIIDKVLSKKGKIDLDKIYEDILGLREKANIHDYDLLLYQEDERELKRMDNIIEGLLTIYEHLTFVEELRKTKFIPIPSEIMDDTIEENKLPDIILEFHRYQVLKKWDKVMNLWNKRSISS